MPKDIAPSKELQEMLQEEVTSEPSLDGMLQNVDLTDQRVKSFFARMSEPQDPQETEQDGIQAEALRRSQVRQLLKGQAGQTSGSSPSQSNTPSTTASTSSAKPNTSK